jgi:tetratricopeptide (TPR) repeat protein
MTEAQKAFDAAIAALKSAVEKDPKITRHSDHLAWTWTHLGHVQFAAGQTTPAHDAFKAALLIRSKLNTTQSDSSQYQDSLAWLLATCPIEELRDAKRSIELSLDTTRQVRESTQYWLTLGAGQLLKGDYSAARISLKDSEKLRGLPDGITMCLLSITESRRKEPQEAEKYLNAAKAWQQAQRPLDEELAYWIKQAEAAVKK